ncbi:HAD-IA family hydrolase [Streptococcus caprae]|uniref:HAD-IA family hydrolase n=1 Tax=Streptococcus caprae TaxID=1640501 RepID=A0ABV8CV13_9STRE
MAKPIFVWDFDGTLVESYAAIMEVLELIYADYGWDFDAESVSRIILQTSIGQLLDSKATEYGLDAKSLKARFMAEQEARDDQIVLMPDAKRVLEETRAQGIKHFIYTHKGATTGAVLERLGIAQYFTEVVTAADGFARKPAPDAMDYLVEKYGLDRQQVYYIGDRPLDRDFAVNSGVQSINLVLPDGPENIHIDSLSAITALPFFQEI